MLVRLVIANVLFDAAAAGAERVTGIEDVDDDIGRVDDLVELTPDTARLTLAVDWLGTAARDGDLVELVGIDGEAVGGALSAGADLVIRGNEADAGSLGLECCLLLVGSTTGLLAALGELCERAHAAIETRALSLGARSESVRVGLKSGERGGLALTRVLNEGHGQLVPAEQDRVRVVDAGAERGAEVVERILGDDACVAEPSLVRLNTTGLSFAALEFGSLDDFAILIADGFGGNAVLGEELYDLGLLGITVEVLALDALDARGLDVLLGGTSFDDGHLGTSRRG